MKKKITVTTVDYKLGLERRLEDPSYALQYLRSCIEESPGGLPEVVLEALREVQRPFTIGPLVCFTSDRNKMGNFVNPKWLTAIAYVILVAIVLLNANLLYKLL